MTWAQRNAKGMAVVNTGNRAFTLIELLIVVAIIAILAAIAVPNFLDAQIRAKVARVTADMSTLHTAIETYRVDHNKIPVRHDNWNNTTAPDYVPDGDTLMGDPAQPTARVGLKMVTTPISYLSSIPPDIFNTPARDLALNVPGVTMSLDYWDEVQLQAFRKNLSGTLNPAKQGFATLSVGPDNYIGLRNGHASRKYPVPPNAINALTIGFYYDATNGTTSVGNVFRFSNNLQQKDLF